MSLNDRLNRLLPDWAQAWLELILLVLQVGLIVLGAVLLSVLLRRLVRRLGERYALPADLVVGGRRVGGFIIYGSAVLLILDRFGVSGTVLWTAFTGFAAVAAVAFFAAWSVLSNIFCTFLIFTTRPFRLYDHVELLESGDKAGLKGQVIDINLIYTTLKEARGEQGDTVLEVPNSLFFQRSIRRWDGAPPVRIPAGGLGGDEVAGMRTGQERTNGSTIVAGNDHDHDVGLR